MSIKKFQLEYYNDATEDFHIQCVKNANLASKPHTHGYFQIYYVITGGLYHYVGEESARMSRGDMFIVPPDVVHYISVEEGTTFYSFSFAPSFLINSSRTPRFVTNFLQSLVKKEGLELRATVSLPPSELLYTESLMANIQKEFELKPLGYYDTVRTLAILVTGYLARSYCEKHNLKEHLKENKEIIRHSVEYIEECYFENITIDKIARQFNMSKSNFCKLFLSETGHTFNNYLNRRRVEKACGYISSGYKLTALYSYVGYNDFSTFYRNFKKHIGVSPAKYKAKNDKK